MKVRKRNLVYLDCEKQGHISALDRVCIDSNCPYNELVCANCIEQLHAGHEVIPLRKLMEKLEDLNFCKEEKPENHDNNHIKGLKTAGANYKERIAGLRKALDDAMAKVEDCLR